MRMLHRRQQGQKQAQARRQAQLQLVTVLVDMAASHMLQHQVRLARR